MRDHQLRTTRTRENDTAGVCTCLGWEGFVFGVAPSSFRALDRDHAEHVMGVVGDDRFGYGHAARIILQAKAAA